MLPACPRSSGSKLLLKQKTPHKLLPLSRGEEGPGRLHSQPACPPPCARLRHTDTRRAPWGRQQVAGRQSCFACHAVAASSTEIPSSSSPSLSAKSSPCFLALAPRDQTRGDRTERKTKPKRNKKVNQNNNNKKKQNNKREFKNSVIAEVWGQACAPQHCWLLTLHLCQCQGSGQHRPGSRFTQAPSPLLHGACGSTSAGGGSAFAGAH